MNKILILDYGSQYTQLIARRIREIGVYCEIISPDDNKKIIEFNPNCIILSGGPDSTADKTHNFLPEEIFQLQVPILGICYGMQLLAKHFGGEVKNAPIHEYGNTEIELLEHKLFQDIHQSKLNVWMSHGDHITHVPSGFQVIAQSNNAVAAFVKDDIYGLQFHPEVSHTQTGGQILENFITKICNCKKDWQAANIIENIVADIKQTVGNNKIVLGLSGGVDSSVVAALLNKACPSQVTCLLVDNGLMRLNEARDVFNLYQDIFSLEIKYIDAKDEFINNLTNVSEPEEKRKIIGKTFIDVFEREAKKIPGVEFLAQGTIYPDIIESGKGKAKVIKSHHNVGGLPEKLNLNILEPLKELFKDEVRKIGLLLGLPENIIMRHPFPGPGLAVRIIGDIKNEYIKILQKADNIFIETLHEFDWYDKVAQAFAVFLPIKSVGVVGDNRRYGYVITLRAVTSSDFMTATFADLPHSLLQTAANKIVNQIPEVSRVTYDISSKPPATIEWE